MRPYRPTESNILDAGNLAGDVQFGEPELYCSMLPLIAAGIGAALSSVGLVKSLSGADENKFQAKAPEMNQNDLQFKGMQQKEWNEKGLYEAARRAPTTDYSQANEARSLALGARDSQANALGMYRDAANGQGPSVAQAQMQQGLEASQRAQASAAASVRGGLARAAANRFAMQNSGDLAAKAVGDMSVLRAQEMLANRQGYAGMASQLRASDAQLQAQDAGQAQFVTNATLQQRQMNDNSAANMFRLGHDAATLNQKGNMIYATTRSDNDLKAQGLNAGVAQQNSDQKAAISAGLINMGGSMMASGLGGGGGGGGGGAAPSAGATASNGGTGAAMGAFAAASDKRLKKNIEPGDMKVKDFLDALHAYNYQYKNPNGPGASPGQHTSVMAQDLEKSELGKQIVEDTPAGKMVDTKEGFATGLAAMASMNKRLNVIEKALKARGKGK